MPSSPTRSAPLPRVPIAGDRSDRRAAGRLALEVHLDGLVATHVQRPVAGADPQRAVRILVQRLHAVATEPVRGGERGERTVLQTDQPAVAGAEPQVAAPTGEHRPDDVARQAVAARERDEGQRRETLRAGVLGADPQAPLEVLEQGVHEVVPEAGGAVVALPPAVAAAPQHAARLRRGPQVAAAILVQREHVLFIRELTRPRAGLAAEEPARHAEPHDVVARERQAARPLAVRRRTCDCDEAGALPAVESTGDVRQPRRAGGTDGQRPHVGRDALGGQLCAHAASLHPDEPPPAERPGAPVRGAHHRVDRLAPGARDRLEHPVV